MFTLLQTVGVMEALKREFLPFGAAFLIASIYYKFGSFALECVAFVATWWLLSFVQSRVLGVFQKN